MINEEAIKGLKSLIEVRRKYCDMQTMKDEIECLEMAIKALEQQPCEDAVSRAEVLKKAVYSETEEGWSGYTVDVEDIKDLPNVQPQPKTGHWEYKRTRIAGKELLAGAYCSECKEECTVYHSEIFDYCPNCGAKMEVSE